MFVNTRAAALMEGTGIYWLAPYEVLEAVGVKVNLINARQVKQLKGRKTDMNDAHWLAFLCQFGLCSPSYVPDKLFRELRKLSRYRRKLVHQRSQVSNRVHKVIDARGLRLSSILSDIFGKNGRRILDGVARGESRERIIEALAGHVRPKLEALFDVLRHQKPYLDPQANYESLIVSRNAARWIKQLREHGYLKEYPERYRQAA